MNFFASWLMLKNLSRIENKEIDYLELFTSLEHLNGEYEKVEDDWGYILTLYSFDGWWYVS